MAERVLFIGWGATVRGREQLALEVFNAAMALYGRLQQDGRIERFDVCLLEPHGGGVDGYIALYGTERQIADVRANTDFQRSMIDASLCVEDLGAVAGWLNEGVAHQIAMYQEAIERVGQSAER